MNKVMTVTNILVEEAWYIRREVNSQVKCQCLHQVNFRYHRCRPIQCCHTIGYFKYRHQNSQSADSAICADEISPGDIAQLRYISSREATFLCRCRTIGSIYPASQPRREYVQGGHKGVCSGRT